VSAGEVGRGEVILEHYLAETFGGLLVSFMILGAWACEALWEGRTRYQTACVVTCSTSKYHSVLILQLKLKVSTLCSSIIFKTLTLSLSCIASRLTQCLSPTAIPMHQANKQTSKRA
jgi:hypothetical protein